MRIISGKYKGKKLRGFDIDGTRPTMDRVKESLFGMIQGYIFDAVVLDLFAGSGALGLEAVSNGCSKVILCDNNRIAINTILYNSKDFDDDIEVINVDYKRFLKETNYKFDVIFLDPPYRAGVLNKAIKIIDERNLLNDGGIIVCEYENTNVICNYEMIKEKRYGSKIAGVYKK